jgi:hypothetical protein
MKNVVELKWHTKVNNNNNNNNYDNILRNIKERLKRADSSAAICQHIDNNKPIENDIPR